MPAVARAALIDVAENGTARALLGYVKRPDGTRHLVGGKTGTGDHRFEVYASPGRLISSRVVNRVATFVFMIDDRFYGTITAFVPGAQAAQYEFTSGLPVRLLGALGLARHLADAAEEVLDLGRAGLEQRLPLRHEISVIVARGRNGHCVHLPVQQNLHRPGILAVTQVPAPDVDDGTAARAVATAARLAISRCPRPPWIIASRRPSHENRMKQAVSWRPIVPAATMASEIAVRRRLRARLRNANSANFIRRPRAGGCRRRLARP